ncbi:MAG TPA: hypothetical protein VG737_03875 [Cyclobacteriaceae bacterium]|nr:hypothetical protein [Cyclobacteriaceae bacterium]
MKKFIWFLSIVLLLVNSVGAFYGGSLLMLDPYGELIHMPLHWLLHSPFVDYFIPGLVLFFVNGVFSLIVALMTFKHVRHYEYYISLQGVLLTGWIIMQVYFLQVVHPLHFIMGGIGVVLFVLGLMGDSRPVNSGPFMQKS